MLSRTHRTVLLVLVTFAVTSAAWAQSFEVRRSAGDPSTARTVPALASTTTAPFEDAFGVLDDGVSYYYIVQRANGSAVSISVDKNLVMNTVEIRFDDTDPASSGLDPALSGVVGDTSAIPADGLTVATFVIIPRNAAGIPLGTGLQVDVDINGLQPGFAAGAVVDLGNGEYTLSVRSWTIGAGTVLVTVEGQLLSDTPRLDYTAMATFSAPVSQQLMQIAYELQAAIDADPAADSAKELADTIKEILKAVEELEATPPDTEKTADRIKNANDHLNKAVEQGYDPVEGQVNSDLMSGFARQFAVEAIDTAIAGKGFPGMIQEALDTLAEGDALLAAGDYASAAHKYKLSIQNATEALG